MRLRPARIAAVALRDARQVLRGRRGWALALITGLLLLPVATLPGGGSGTSLPPSVIPVAGEVPDAVLALDAVIEVDSRRARLVFRTDPSGTLVVSGPSIPPVVRDALDGEAPAVSVEMKVERLSMPGRSLLFALIAASVLTGAVTESIPGERSRGSLQALLSAAITRGELVVGKWAAWAGYGAVAAVGAALVAVLGGRVEAGWWLLPLGTVPACTVALGLYLVRRARDVVGGATISLRVLPALLGLSGVGGWVLGQTHPLLGAALPLGGALIATGGTWPGLLPPLVATASTLATTFALLALTARDLEQDLPRARLEQPPLRLATITAALAAPGCWVALAGALLWAPAGNPGLVDQLAREPGVQAAAVVLIAITVVQAGRSSTPLQLLGLRLPRPGAWPWAVGVGAILAVASSGFGLLVLPASPLFEAASQRIAEGLHPDWAGLPSLMLMIAAQELLFRGWLQRGAGPVLATLAFALVHAPLDPVPALLIGGTLAALVHRTGSMLPALVARLAWVVAALWLPEVGPGIGLAVGAAALAALVGWAARAPEEAPR